MSAIELPKDYKLLVSIRQVSTRKFITNWGDTKLTLLLIRKGNEARIDRAR